ncbi:cohesin domain-containing protein [Patescibacteria group bacterium]
MKTINKINSMLLKDKKRVFAFASTLFIGLFVLFVIRNWVRLVTEPLYEPGITTSETFPSLSLQTDKFSVAEGQYISIDVVLSPAGNPVSGVDAVINFDSDYLDITEADITKSISGFGTFIKSVEADPNSTTKTIRLAFLTYVDGAPTNPVSSTEPVKLATISFLAKTETPQEGILISFNNNGTNNDSNIIKISENYAIDLLTEDNSQDLILLITIPTPTSTPTPTMVPTVPPTITKIPTRIPTPILSCGHCFKGECDQKCNSAKEDYRCPDCAIPSNYYQEGERIVPTSPFEILIYWVKSLF